MNTSEYTKITPAVMKAFALGYHSGRVVGVEENPYSQVTYADEYKAYADGFEAGAADFAAY
jgi:hypothetical protein